MSKQQLSWSVATGTRGGPPPKVAFLDEFVTIRRAYDDYVKLADRPVKYDSFRRLVNQGKVRSHLQDGRRLVSRRSVGEHVLRVELSPISIDDIGPPEIYEEEAIWRVPGVDRVLGVTREEDGFSAEVTFFWELDMLMAELLERDTHLILTAWEGDSDDGA